MYKTRGAQHPWEAKEEGSQPGAAPLGRVRLGELGFASLGGRREPLAVPTSCPVAMKDPLSRSAGDSGSMETRPDIVIYGTSVTLETK